MPVCIYCCKEKNQRQFHKEHLIPEGAGYTEYSKKIVCGECNEILSKIDQEFVTQPPISLTRAILGMQCKKKKGRTTKARFQNGGKSIFWKNGHLEFHGFDYPKAFTNGLEPLQISHSTQQEKVIPFQRSVHKIGMNLLAAKMRPSIALEPQFDFIRNWILKGEPRELRTIHISSDAKVNNTFQIFCRPEGPAFVQVGILGIKFIFSLIEIHSCIDNLKVNVAELKFEGLKFPITHYLQGILQFHREISLIESNRSSIEND